MKKVLMSVFVILYTIPVFSADLAGFKTPQEAVKAFLNPLKQGSKGVNEAVNNSSVLNGQADSELTSELKKTIKISGKLVGSQEVNSSSRLNGNMIQYTYELKFANGSSKRMQFTVLRPQADGGFMIMKSGFVD